MTIKEKLLEWMYEDSGVLYDKMHEGVFNGYVTFTPERAAEILEINTKNRKLGEKKQMPQIIRALEGGFWNDNVSKINITASDVLSDGQNRLSAIVKSKISARLLVTYGVSDDAQAVTDRRGERKLYDDLEIEGCKSSRTASAITRILFLRDKGFTVRELINRGRDIRGYADYQLLGFYHDHSEEIHKTERYCSNTYQVVRHLQINRTVVSILAIEFKKINEEDSTYFWRALAKGVFSDEYDPIALLHARLVSNALNKTKKIPTHIQCALIIKAWNCFERGEHMKTLKYTSGGAKPEPFPEIYNPNEE